MASNAENVSIWWRHHEFRSYPGCCELNVSITQIKTKWSKQMKYVHNTNYIHEAMDIRLGKSVEVFLAPKRPFHIHIFRTEHVIQNEYKINHMVQLLRKLSCNWSEWVIEFNGLSGDSGERGPYSPYKTCTHSLYIGIIIFPHIDNPQSTGGHNLL